MFLRKFLNLTATNTLKKTPIKSFTTPEKNNKFKASFNFSSSQHQFSMMPTTIINPQQKRLFFANFFQFEDPSKKVIQAIQSNSLKIFVTDFSKIIDDLLRYDHDDHLIVLRKIFETSLHNIHPEACEKEAQFLAKTLKQFFTLHYQKYKTRDVHQTADLALRNCPLTQFLVTAKIKHLKAEELLSYESPAQNTLKLD
jgi:hypothetical protein